jgi:predicted AlkP superfamily pyrophosphatase or phosphodiesterase
MVIAVTTQPEPLAPAFDGPSLTGVVRAVAARVRGLANDGFDWAPASLAGARQAVLLVVDGLGWEQLQHRLALARTLSGGDGSAITSVAPSTTAVALTSLSTGLAPAAHGIVGYRMAMDGAIFNALRWRLAEHDARRVVPALELQSHPGFRFSEDARAGAPVVTRADFASSGFSAAFLSGCPMVPWHAASGLVVGVRRLLAAGEQFVVAYYDGLDHIAHLHGLGEHYDAELMAIDRLVADLLGILPQGAALAVTADHGQVDVGTNVEILGAELMAGVSLLSGEGRFRWLHARSGAAGDVAEIARERYSSVAWVRTRDEVIEDGWLGGRPAEAVRARLGDVALVPFAPIAFLDPADTGEQRLIARHGSLTPAEMLVPLLAWLPRP